MWVVRTYGLRYGMLGVVCPRGGEKSGAGEWCVGVSSERGVAGDGGVVCSTVRLRCAECQRLAAGRVMSGARRVK
jgi:hypothetical protein